MRMLEFLTLKPIAFGIDISDFSVKIVKLKRKGLELDLSCFGEASIPAGLIEGGEIKNEGAVAKIIREAIPMLRGEKIRSEEAVASLPEEKAFLRMIQFPRLSEEELRTAVPFEAENHIPFSIKECCLDFMVVEPLVNHLDHLDVLLVACPQKVVDSYSRVLKMAGLIPVALETDSLAISRALIKNWITLQPVLLVDIGANRTNLVIYSGKSIRFTNSLPFSSMKLTEALASGLGVGKEEAEKIKINYGLEAETKVQFLEKAGDSQLERKIVSDSNKILQIFLPALLSLSSEIKNFLDFYYSHTTHEHMSTADHEVKKILLSGGGANLKGVDQFLSKQLGIPVFLGNPWINILSEPRLKVPEEYLRRSLLYTNALGLALRGVLNDTANR